ncbi:hypothetical protein [Novosphingobium sp.]|uniref:hypothetical protein n=1 Tax=Novosphingobium sp. TaxID=1874826 RepID=UPI002605789E|nr:hypothetical protein [Novosphingobium sp.]
MQRKMKTLSLGLAALQMVWSGVALACDGCEEDEAFYGFLAYVDFRGLNDEQQAAARQSAIDAYHQRKMSQAKAAFTARFKVDPAPQSQQQPQETADSAEQERKLASQ